MAKKSAGIVTKESRKKAPGRLPSDPSYTPGKLLDHMIAVLNLKNDAGLARAMKWTPPDVSKIRHRAKFISAAKLVDMVDVSECSLGELRALAGMTSRFEA